LVYSQVPKDHFGTAIGAKKYIRPDGVVDFALDAVRVSSIRVPGLVHPAAFLLDLPQDTLGFALKGDGIHRRVVVIGNECGGWRKVIEHCLAGAQTRDGFLALPNHPVFIHLVAQGFHGLFIAAQLSSHAGHARAAKAVEDDIAWVGVVQDVTHNGFMRDLGVVRMRVVDGVILALRDVGRKRLALIAVII